MPDEVAARYSRDPLGGLDEPATDPATDLLRHAVLIFGDPDGPARWAEGARLLAAHPSLPAADVHVAAAAADLVELRRHLSADPESVDREGGPFGWPPLLYLTYSRLALAGVPGDPLGSAALLLAAGADPDAGFLWQGLVPPFTALTGVFGSADDARPAHPDADRLARALLAAGADPNDGQTLYNRMFASDDHHLELLLDAGLGQGDGGPWRRRLPEAADAPRTLVSSQLGWAVARGRLDRIRLLARHGADLTAPLGGAWLPAALALPPVALAWRCGRPEAAALLTELGASAETDGDSRWIGSLLTGVEPGLMPEDLARLRREHPSLVLRAAVADRLDGVRLLVEHGFDVDALGRQDLPLEQRWETALHHAAGEGKRELAVLLLELGADPAVRDHRFDATPLGWAQEFDRTDLVALLGPVTPAD